MVKLHRWSLLTYVATISSDVVCSFFVFVLGVGLYFNLNLVFDILEFPIPRVTLIAVIATHLGILVALGQVPRIFSPVLSLFTCACSDVTCC